MNSVNTTMNIESLLLNNVNTTMNIEPLLNYIDTAMNIQLLLNYNYGHDHDIIIGPLLNTT